MGMEPTAQPAVSAPDHDEVIAQDRGRHDQRQGQDGVKKIPAPEIEPGDEPGEGHGKGKSHQGRARGDP